MDVFSEIRNIRTILVEHIRKTSNNKEDISLIENTDMTTNINERFDKLECMILELKNELFDKLDNLELYEKEQGVKSSSLVEKKELENESEIFIPTIIHDNSSIKTKNEKTSTKVNDDLSSSVDALVNMNIFN